MYAYGEYIGSDQLADMLAYDFETNHWSEVDCTSGERYTEDGDEEPEFQWNDDVKRGKNDVSGDNDKEDDREEHNHDVEGV